MEVEQQIGGGPMSANNQLEDAVVFNNDNDEARMLKFNSMNSNQGELLGIGG